MRSLIIRTFVCFSAIIPLLDLSPTAQRPQWITGCSLDSSPPQPPKLGDYGSHFVGVLNSSGIGTQFSTLGIRR